VNQCFCNIQQCIIHCFKSVQKVIINDKHSFELYGFDFLIDENLGAWLLEINASPSLSGTAGIDGDLKNHLIDDTFTIVDMEKVLSGNEVQVGGFD
jgi:tubulin polyglutamylase TTLL9